MHSRFDPLPIADVGEAGLLPFGNGRSYGDSCLNEGGLLLDTRGLDRFIRFDPQRALLRCESGVLLGEINALIHPHGLVLPTTPGTRFVTVGGALANDVHGKNHHRVGSFGCHVTCLELLRSDGERLLCSAEHNADWFAATIGGLGLTGLVTWAEIALRRVPTPDLEVEFLPCANLDQVLEQSQQAEQGHEYIAAWIDCLARGPHLGRGYLMRANHASTASVGPRRPPRRAVRVPLTPPLSPLNACSLRIFNALIHARHARGVTRRRMSYDAFHYPLDAVLGWNRLYGPRGFLQYQCVVPEPDAGGAIRRLLERIAAAGEGSFLTVLKKLGDRPSTGMLSFPRPGLSLALDFPFRGDRTLRLLRELDETVARAGGALYPAKDARMSAEMFASGYSRAAAAKAFHDPRFSSSFWRRVMPG
ncbi:MAG: FAD-binding oxidoreductase [Gammaproteobacteria bacterium]|nr:FAD-binding oxidoreductase [Gammaproteobacteria bacterium]